MKDYDLICTKCKKEYKKETIDFRCEICKEPLEVEELHNVRTFDRNTPQQSILKRYREFYPFISVENGLSLGEGFTPLITSKRLAKDYGVGNIYFKNESKNPTWSFKDRGTLTGVLRARDLGYKRIGTVSTGNMATSVAAYGSKANMETFIFVKKGILSEKLNPIAIYNPNLIIVDGDYSKLYEKSFKLGEDSDIYFINSDVPYRVEGYKTISFEICEQLDFEIPDYIIVPTSAGGNIRGIEKGFREFKNVGLIERVPKMIAVQASGCSPIYDAFVNNKENIDRYPNPNTIAHAIENPYPPSGNQVLRMIRRNEGTIISVSDDEIIKAQREMGGAGIFAQPASATSLAAIKKLRSNNYLNNKDNVVCIVTASGLKDTSELKRQNLKTIDCNINDLDKAIKKM